MSSGPHDITSSVDGSAVQYKVYTEKKKKPKIKFCVDFDAADPQPEREWEQFRDDGDAEAAVRAAARRVKSGAAPTQHAEARGQRRQKLLLSVLRLSGRGQPLNPKPTSNARLMLPIEPLKNVARQPLLKRLRKLLRLLKRLLKRPRPPRLRKPRLHRLRRRQNHRRAALFARRSSLRCL